MEIDLFADESPDGHVAAEPKIDAARLRVLQAATSYIDALDAPFDAKRRGDAQRSLRKSVRRLRDIGGWQ